MRWVVGGGMAVLGLVMASWAWGQEATRTLTERTVKELGGVPEDFKNMDWVRVNAQGDRVAGVVKRGERYRIFANGKLSREYDEIGWLEFSSDGSHLVYQASGGGKLVSTGWLSSPERVGGWYTVIDERRFGPYEACGFIEFSEDGKRCAWSAYQNDRAIVVVDGKRMEGGEGARQFRFSADGKHTAFIDRYGDMGLYGLRWGREEHEDVFVWDGKAGPEYDEIRSFDMTADGKHTAYQAVRGDKWTIVRDGQEGPWYAVSQDISGDPTFSPDGKQLAYTAMRDGKAFLVLEGKEGERYGRATWPTFSPDGQRVCFRAWEKDFEFIVCDGKKGPIFPYIDAVTFSRDGKHLAYVGAYRFIVRDGEVGEELDGSTEAVTFSPDGKHLGWCVTTDDTGHGSKMFVMVDGMKGPMHEWAGIPTKGGDERVLRYVAIDKGEARLVEVEWPAGLDWRNGMVKVEGK